MSTMSHPAGLFPRLLHIPWLQDLPALDLGDQGARPLDAPFDLRDQVSKVLRVVIIAVVRRTGFRSGAIHLFRCGRVMNAPHPLQQNVEKE